MVGTKSEEPRGVAGDCSGMEQTEPGAQGSKRWGVAKRVLPGTWPLLEGHPRVEAGELPQLQLIPRGWLRTADFADDPAERVMSQGVAKGRVGTALP